jgi:hypothetical protein
MLAYGFFFAVYQLDLDRIIFVTPEARGFAASLMILS